MSDSDEDMPEVEEVVQSEEEEGSGGLDTWCLDLDGVETVLMESTWLPNVGDPWE